MRPRDTCLLIKPMAGIEHNVSGHTEQSDAPPWYISVLQHLNPVGRDLFENYSKVPSDDVIEHITIFRDKAFKVYPYPCLGRWGFLDFSICQSASYAEVLDRVKTGQKCLDVGCCFGQDIRKLVHDGAPSENMYGCDLRKDFMEIGYDLFLDKRTLKTTFVAADIFEPNSDLRKFDGQFSIVHAASFFHLFDWDCQVLAAKNVAALLKPGPGSLIVGRQAGNVISGPGKGNIFVHDCGSFIKLWKQVGEETKTKWNVEAQFTEDVLGFAPPGTRWLAFTVRKL